MTTNKLCKLKYQKLLSVGFNPNERVLIIFAFIFEKGNSAFWWAEGRWRRKKKESHWREIYSQFVPFPISGWSALKDLEGSIFSLVVLKHWSLSCLIFSSLFNDIHFLRFASHFFSLLQSACGCKTVTQHL